MSIAILYEKFPEWEGLPIKIKSIIEDVAYICKKHCGDYLLINDIEKLGTDYLFICDKLPKSGANGILRMIEILNEIYQFDPRRETIPFIEEYGTGFIFRCGWETHSLNKEYKKGSII